MGTITLPNFRTTADVKMNTRLKDGGVYIEWSSLTDIKAWIYSDAQKAIAGRVDVSVDTEDATVLKCLYASTKPQYPGVNRLIVQGRYNGSLKTYDKPVFNFVPRTAEATGSITISDPEVDVEIEVTDTTSSILDNTIAAALAAAAHAEHAASLVPLQVLQDCEAATAVALTAASKAPVIGENGNWWVWNSQQAAYVDTGKQAKGDTGNGIASFSVVESQEDDADNVVTVEFTDGTMETFNVKNGKTGNGIASIVQTVESPDDAGTNVITVTMTDGTVITFNVKNGSKGQPGAAQAAYKSVETLPTASAETMDKIYLTPSGTSGVYNMSYTDYDGSAYSWVNMGTTAIQLSDYATKAEFSQLRHKVDDLFENTTSDYAIADENGNNLVEFSEGHIKTKNFNSADILKVEENRSGDLCISDNERYVLCKFENGHIKTKNFDSSKLPIKAIRKAVFMGDSITQGVYSYWNGGIHTDENRYNGFDISDATSVQESTEYHGIHYYFGLFSGAEMVNLGKRGTGWVADTRNLGNALVVATNYSFSDVDFVALFFGVNDYIQGKAIGTIGTAGTVRGNMASVIQKIASDNPLCKIVVYSPYNTFGQVSKGGDYVASDTLYGDESTNYALGYDYKGKGTLSDYIASIDDVCAYYGVQHVKLSASNVVNRLTIKNIMIDGLHPSKEAYPMLAAEIYGKGNFGA